MGATELLTFAIGGLAAAHIAELFFQHRKGTSGFTSPLHTFRSAVGKANVAISITSVASLLMASYLLVNSRALSSPLKPPRSNTPFMLSLLLAFDIVASFAAHLYCSKAGKHMQTCHLQDEEMGSIGGADGRYRKREEWSRHSHSCPRPPHASSFLMGKEDNDTMRRLAPLKIRTQSLQRQHTQSGGRPWGPGTAEDDIFDFLMQGTVRSLVEC